MANSTLDNLLIGFEIECYIFTPDFRDFVDDNMTRASKGNMIYNWERGRKLLEEIINNKVRRKSRASFLSKNDHPMKYVVKDDQSILPDADDVESYMDKLDPKISRKLINPCFEFEITGPPMPYAVAMAELVELFSMMCSYGFRTNFSTGLHVNISFVDDSKKYSFDNFSPTMLTTLYNEDRSLKEWRTEDQEYTSKLGDEITRFVKKHKRSNWNAGEVVRKTDKSVLLGASKTINGLASRYKYKTINIGSYWSEDKYIEFRVIGGDNYHYFYTEVRKEIDTFCDVFLRSTKNKQNTKDVNKVIKYVKSVTR